MKESEEYNRVKTELVSRSKAHEAERKENRPSDHSCLDSLCVCYRPWSWLWLLPASGECCPTVLITTALLSTSRLMLMASLMDSIHANREDIWSSSFFAASSIFPSLLSCPKNSAFSGHAWKKPASVVSFLPLAMFPTELDVSDLGSACSSCW